MCCAAQHLPGAARAVMELCGVGAGSYQGWRAEAQGMGRPAAQLESLGRHTNS